MPLQTRPAEQRAIITLSAVVVAAIITTALYVGRIVLVPIAMAIFFAYVLSPVVSYWQRRGLGRTFSVAITVSTSLLVLIAGSFLVTHELANLTDDVAAKAPSIRAKLANAKAAILGSGNSPLRTLLDEMDITAKPQPETPQTVVLEPSRPAWTTSLNTVVAPATEAFGQMAFSFILVVFMLLSKTDLADRLLRLVGDGRVTATTRAMAEASQRISRYLFRQLVVNSSFGVYVAASLYLIGLQYSLLWGILIAVLRYVPYIGTWIGVIPPAIYAFTMGEDWSLLFATLGLVLGGEIILGNFLEPRIYGTSLGVSEVAQLIAAAFWSFLWGPVGLILSGPITTCLLVLGRHAPPFRFLEVLLGNQPPLTPGMALYQRLAARDQDEALRTVRQATTASPGPGLFDDVFIPALSQVKTARIDSEFDADDEARIIRIAREVLDETLEEIRIPPIGNEEFVQRIRLMICPAQDEFDRLTLDMLAARIPLAKWEVRLTAVATLTAELLADAAAYDPQVIAIGSLPPGGVSHARYLCKRLRARFPEAKILVGRWGEESPEAEAWKSVGADKTATTIAAAADYLNAWQPVFQAEKAAVGTTS